MMKGGRVLRILAWCFVFLFVMYWALMGMLVAFSDKVIYNPTNESFVVPEQESVYEGIPVTVFPGEGDRVVLYLQGNTGKRSGLLTPMRAYQEEGYTVVSFAYAGAEGRFGKMNQEQMLSDALIVFDGLEELTGIKSPKIFVHGYSMGGAIGIYLSAKRDFQAFVAQAPVVSFCSIIKEKLWMPACILRLDTWDMRSITREIDEPVLIIHGGKDNIVPSNQSDWLLDDVVSMGGEGVKVVYEEVGHTGFQDSPYLETIFAWLALR